MLADKLFDKEQLRALKKSNLIIKNNKTEEEIQEVIEYLKNFKSLKPILKDLDYNA